MVRAPQGLVRSLTARIIGGGPMATNSPTGRPPPTFATASICSSGRDNRPYAVGFPLIR